MRYGLREWDLAVVIQPWFEDANSDVYYGGAGLPRMDISGDLWRHRLGGAARGLYRWVCEPAQGAQAGGG